METAKPAGDVCFCPVFLQESLVHGLDEPRRKGKQEVQFRRRKPGDDECGLQPRITVRDARSDGHRKSSAKGKSKPKGRRGKGRVKKAKADDVMARMHDNAGAFLRQCDEEPWNPVPHGAKTRATLELVQKWQNEAPDDKIISGLPCHHLRLLALMLTMIAVFAQWIPMLCILGRMLFQNGFRFVYLWGEMRDDHQQRSIQVFQKVSEVKVMVSIPRTF